MDLVFTVVLLLCKPLLSRFIWFVRLNKPIGPLWIQWWYFCCRRFSGWLDIALAVSEWFGEPFAPTAAISNAPELRVFAHSNCGIIFCHIEKGIVWKSWAKFDHWLARHWNFSGKETVLQLSADEIHTRLDVPYMDPYLLWD